MPLFRLLFLALLLVPVLEVYLLVQVGSLIGAVPTVGLVILTATVGTLLMRHQGLATLDRVRVMSARGEPPTLAMLEGVVILLSGALLLTPGFFTDAIGLLGLIPPLRRRLLQALIRKGMVAVAASAATPSPGGRGSPTTIDGDYTREDD